MMNTKKKMGEQQNTLSRPAGWVRGGFVGFIFRVLDHPTFQILRITESSSRKEVDRFLFYLAVNIVCWMVALVALLALLSYSPSDPSLNSSSALDTQNWLGENGAIVADMAHQVLGLGSYMVILLVALWNVDRILIFRTPTVRVYRLVVDFMKNLRSDSGKAGLPSENPGAASPQSSILDKRPKKKPVFGRIGCRVMGAMGAIGLVSLWSEVYLFTDPSAPSHGGIIGRWTYGILSDGLGMTFGWFAFLICSLLLFLCLFPFVSGVDSVPSRASHHGELGPVRNPELESEFDWAGFAQASSLVVGRSDQPANEQQGWQESGQSEPRPVGQAVGIRRGMRDLARALVRLIPSPTILTEPGPHRGPPAPNAQIPARQDTSGVLANQQGFSQGVPQNNPQHPIENAAQGYVGYEQPPDVAARVAPGTTLGAVPGTTLGASAGPFGESVGTLPKPGPETTNLLTGQMERSPHDVGRDSDHLAAQSQHDAPGQEAALPEHRDYFDTHAPNNPGDGRGTDAIPSSPTVDRSAVENSANHANTIEPTRPSGLFGSVGSREDDSGRAPHAIRRNMMVEQVRSKIGEDDALLPPHLRQDLNHPTQNPYPQPVQPPHSQQQQSPDPGQVRESSVGAVGAQPPTHSPETTRPSPADAPETPPIHTWPQSGSPHSQGYQGGSPGNRVPDGEYQQRGPSDKMAAFQFDEKPNDESAGSIGRSDENTNDQWNLSYQAPSFDLLVEPDEEQEPIRQESLQMAADLLVTTLNEYGISGGVESFQQGPFVTVFEYELAPGTKESKIFALVDDIGRNMDGRKVRIGRIPNRPTIGIEVSNRKPSTVSLRSLLENQDFMGTSGLPIALGVDTAGRPVFADLDNMPHLLVAGRTGSGKSCGLNSMIISLLYRFSPENCRLLLIDPKDGVEFSVYEEIPHLMGPVARDAKQAIGVLKWTIAEMDRRYGEMRKLRTRNLADYQARVSESRRTGRPILLRVEGGYSSDGEPELREEVYRPEWLPHLVLVIDEISNLMSAAARDIESGLRQLAEKGRAAGIHLIIATQRPDVRVLTGTIKANFPCRLSFAMATSPDSRTILDQIGAEQLIGYGDSLFLSEGKEVTRIHGPYVSASEVEAITRDLSARYGSNYDSELESIIRHRQVRQGQLFGGEGDVDELYESAVALVRETEKASISLLQRKLKVGYNRSARMVEMMEDHSVVSKPDAYGARQVLPWSD